MSIKVTWDVVPIAAIVFSLLVAVVPGLKQKFEALLPEKKQLVMIGALLVVTLGGVALSLAGFLAVYHYTTWREWVWYPTVDFVIGVLTNAGIYKGTNYLFAPKPPAEAPH